MLKWLVQRGASSARGDESFCPSCSPMTLTHNLKDWANTCQKDDNVVLHTWDYTANPSGCEFCSFMKSEVDRIDAYKAQIRNIRSFVGGYQTLKDVIQQAEFDEGLQKDAHEEVDNDSEELDHDKARCLVCEKKDLPGVSVHDAGFLCYEFLQNLDNARTGHPKVASQVLKEHLPYCNQIIGHMEHFLRRHPESESCPVCVSISDSMDGGGGLDRLGNLGLQEKKDLVRNHGIPNVGMRLSLNAIQQVQVQLSNEGPWKGLILQEYEMDPKAPNNLRYLSLSYESPRAPKVLRPAYRQPEKDVNLFIPVHDHKFGFARPTNPKFNVELMKSWITKCRYNHGEACQKQSSSKHTTGLFLIDVERYCITPIPNGPPPLYFALSYVWGNVAQPILLAENLKAWQTDGMLLEVEIPQKIKDAIILTKEAGVRYLWVDALCIVQDDAELRDEQINQMYLIYHQAEATIVAADTTDCSQGLSGVSQNGDRGDIATVDMLGTSVAKVPRQPKYILETSPWRTRGWTFQEEMCSLRSVIFLPGLVVFSCPTAVWREDIHLEDFDIPRLSCGLNSLPRTMGNANASAQEKVRMFRSIVKQYTQRTLTRAEDMENAFAGISGMVEDLVGPIYHGIPEHHFAQVVGGCWFWDMYCARRPGFPTWSWTGWIYTREQADAGIEPIPSLGSPDGLIQFFKFRSDAIEPMSSPTSETDPKSWLHPDLRSHFNVELNKMQYRHEQMIAAPQGIPPGLIAFYSSLAFLSLQAPHGLSSTPIREFRVLHPQTRRQMTSISLPENFVELHGALHPFVIIAACEANGRDAGGMRLMLVEMGGDICHKVNVTSPRKVIREGDWLGLNPTKKLVIMA
ncbi:unnamed protein product [Clonostachys rosea]|uniref:Heterokaryon incompatibility domain-containing protein n=1 Tax=Bionectria ochroleuca TaxID=29856 RepID=A0ABY6UK20_BIOOC|nr:unnamed protein product [Clonostachys rosea]